MTKYVKTTVTQLSANETAALEAINKNFEDIQASIQDAVSRSAQTPSAMTAELDMNGKRFLNVPAPTTSTDVVRKVDVVGDIESVRTLVSSATTAAGSAITSAQTATTKANEANTSAANASTYSTQSKQYAIGDPSEPTEHSAKWWAEHSGLPDQSGKAGKFLKTDGSGTSWESVDAFPSQSGQAGKFLTTNGTNVSWGTVQSIQVSTMPTASASLVGTIYQYVGTTDSNYTNGLFYKCIQATSNIAATLTLTTSGTAGLGTLTGNATTFGNQVSNWPGTYDFEYRAEINQIKLYTGDDIGDYIAATRNPTEDENGYYAWDCPNDVVIYTDTRTPTSSTLFYNESDGDESNHSNYWYEDEVLSYSTTYGKWQYVVIDINDGEEFADDVDLSDYGISYNGVALIGAKISAVYTSPISNVTTYSWTNINVQQPSTTITYW